MKNWRINLVFVLIFILGAVVIGRLVFIQIIRGDRYRAWAFGQQGDFDVSKSQRGEILFNNGQILAIDLAGAGKLRKYPQGSMASILAGFMGGEGKGQYGVEGYYDDVLNEKDIILTIDYNIQFMAENLLKTAKDNLDIEGGQIIVIDPNSGKILSLAAFPSFDPNRYFEVEDFSLFQNGAVQKLFEPGSVMKPITMAAALDQGKIDPSTTYIDTGSVRIGDYTIGNYAGRCFGKATMTEVLEKSINTGAVFAEKQVGNSVFMNYLEKFGFFNLTEIDLQGEVFSENKELKKGSVANFATAAFGQGIEITPIQLVRAFCAIANGGIMVKPYLADSGKDPELSSEKIISSNTASKIAAMMVSVVENGYVKSIRIPGYYIAGKTGTAQVPWSALGIDKKGYSDKTWQSFIGFFPAFNPQFVVLVKLDNPKASTAEYSAAPIFKELVKYIIDYKAIPPDYE